MQHAGKKFREWRKANRVTQVDASIAMGVTQAAVSTFERTGRCRILMMRKINNLTGGYLHPNALVLSEGDAEPVVDEIPVTEDPSKLTSSAPPPARMLRAGDFSISAGE